MKVFKTNIGDSASALRQNQNEEVKGEEHSIKENPKKRGLSESMNVADAAKKQRLEGSNPDGQKEKNSADSKNQAGEESQTNLEDHERQIDQPDEDKDDKKEKADDEMETDQPDENTEQKKEKAGDKDNEMETGQSTIVREDQTRRFDETADEIESVKKITANASDGEDASINSSDDEDHNTSKISSDDEDHNTSKHSSDGSSDEHQRH